MDWEYKRNVVVNGELELVKIIQKSTPEEAKKLLVQYGNQRVEKSISDCWVRFRKMLRFMVRRQSIATKDFLLDHDADNSAFVSVVGLHKYLYKIDNEMKKIAEDCSEETLDALAQIEDCMSQSLGSVRLDFRLAYSSED